MHNKKSKVSCSLFCGAGIGAIAAILLSLILAATVALMILNETVGEDALQYFTFAILVLSVFTGALTANKLVMRKYALVTAAVAAAYLVVLISVALLCFDGVLTGVLLGVLAVGVGGIASCAVCIRMNSKDKKRKYRPR